MKCKKIQEIILTDYLDGQLAERQRSLLSRHLAGCQGCKKFSIYVMKNIAGLFTNAERLIPSEIVWRRIKGSIEDEETNKPAVVIGFFERLRGVLCIPKPVMIFATALTFILVTSLVLALYIGNQNRLNYSSQKTIQDNDYYEKLFSDAYTAKDTGFGTAIEENFL